MEIKHTQERFQESHDLISRKDYMFALCTKHGPYNVLYGEYVDNKQNCCPWCKRYDILNYIEQYLKEKNIIYTRDYLCEIRYDNDVWEADLFLDFYIEYNNKKYGLVYEWDRENLPFHFTKKHLFGIYSSRQKLRKYCNRNNIIFVEIRSFLKEGFDIRWVLSDIIEGKYE